MAGTLGWALAIWQLAMRPQNPPLRLFLSLWDKLDHAAAFFVLALLLAGVLVGVARLPALGIQLGVAVGYGIAIEVGQYLGKAGRSAEALDVVADLAGMGLALGLIELAGWKQRGLGKARSERQRALV